ncbi:MAG: zf-TFIIB domain-containing protein [Candidatus Nanopelagicales bacterium]
MQCPKCHGDMRSYERNGITIDQCTECRGVFLDRGELDHLIGLEASAMAPAAAPAPPAAPAYSGRAPEPSYGGKPYKKRKSFLEELFD